jgi:virginiamycin B lyase
MGLLRSLLLPLISAVALAASTPAVLNVQIYEYDVPTPNSRPHDPAIAPDGSLWYTGQAANKLGRLDPQTGTFKEYPLKTANSGPHGLVADHDGNVWFTAIYAGYVGKLDPKTGDIREYRTEDGTKIDPHTPVIDHNGDIWFTNEETNYIGRIDPNTGKMTLAKVPTPHAVPYGIVILPNNTPLFCEFGSNKLATIDPANMQIHEYTLPGSDARPRRLALSTDGTVYYTDFARGYLGHFDPARGMPIKEYPSPGGESSEPYGIAITKDGEVWYSESGVHPNTLVKFDPKSESFSEEAIPSGGGTVRNMVATPDGRLYLACSGVNKVAIVDLNQQAGIELMHPVAPIESSSGLNLRPRNGGIVSAFRESPAPGSKSEKSQQGSYYPTNVPTAGTAPQADGVQILSDTMGVDLNPYLRQSVLPAVKKNWQSAVPESAQWKKGQVAIEFVISKTGKVSRMKLVGSSGDMALDHAAWAGIANSNPFPALPSEFAGEYLRLRFAFAYNPSMATAK